MSRSSVARDTHNRELTRTRGTKSAITAPQSERDQRWTETRSSGPSTASSRLTNYSHISSSLSLPSAFPASVRCASSSLQAASRGDGHSSSSQTLDCGICLQGLVVERTVELRACGHKFHENCLNKWAAETPRWRNTPCPYCREEIV